MPRVLVLLALVLASGCAAPDAPAGLPPDPASAPRQEDAPAPARPDGPEAPIWSVGDWWRWEVSSPRSDAYEVTTVVTAADGSGYALGVTDLDAGLRSVWFHLPPLGRVDARLAWEMHDRPAVLLDLPLAEGKVWTGEIEGEPVAFEAEAVEGGFRVVGRYEGGGEAVVFTWSDDARQFGDIALHYGSPTPWALARLVDHGRGHAAPTTLLLADDALLAGAGSPGAPRAPASFVIPGEATHVVLGCLLAGGPGAYAITFVPPAGRAPMACEHRSDAAGGPGAMRVLTAEAIPGTWHAALAPAGAGYVFTEVAAVTALPS